VGEALAEVLRDGTVRRQGGWVPPRGVAAPHENGMLGQCAGMSFTALRFAAQR
jgi:hypothetical protein